MTILGSRVTLKKQSFDFNEQLCGAVVEGQIQFWLYDSDPTFQAVQN